MPSAPHILNKNNRNISALHTAGLFCALLIIKHHAVWLTILNKNTANAPHQETGLIHKIKTFFNKHNHLSFFTFEHI